MPTITQEQVKGFAHCEDVFCDGNAQQPVDVVHTTTAYTYRENGGDLNGFERSFTSFGFAVESDQACPHCGKPRACDVQERPSYPTSQYRQDGLLKLLRGEFEGAGLAESLMAQKAKGRSPAGGPQQADERVAELQRQLAEQSAQLAEMREQLAKRGPGRPRKTEAEPEAE